MKTFYIYEVPGIKNGATKDWESRSSYNFNHYGVQPVIVETYELPDTEEGWQFIGDREWELADINGYPRGDHYKVIRRKGINGGRIGGLLVNSQNLSFEARSKGGKTSGKMRRKLSYEIANQIRKEYQNNNITYDFLVNKYNLSRANLWKIIHNKSYKER